MGGHSGGRPFFIMKPVRVILAKYSPYRNRGTKAIWNMATSDVVWDLEELLDWGWDTISWIRSSIATGVRK